MLNADELFSVILLKNGLVVEAVEIVGSGVREGDVIRNVAFAIESKALSIC